MSDHRLLTFIKDKKLSQILDPDENISCEYYDESMFNRLNRNERNHLNILSMNIVSLPKHGGELVNFLDLLQSQFQIVVISEIGARNISTVENLLPGYSFYYVLPSSNAYGGVGIYFSECIEEITVLDEKTLQKSCHCLK